MTLSAAYNPARRDLLMVTDKDPTTVSIPVGYQWKTPVRPQGAGDVWDWTALDFVTPPVAPVVDGLPSGALVYVLDPADALAMPVDVLKATDPAPAAPKTTAPLKARPRPGYEWDGTAAAFVAPSALKDRITHDPLLDLVDEWRSLRDALAESKATPTNDLTPHQAQLQTLVDRARRKVALTLAGRAKAP